MESDDYKVIVYKDGSAEIGRVTGEAIMVIDGGRSFCSDKTIKDIAAEI